MSQVRLAAIPSATVRRTVVAAVITAGFVAFGTTATAAADEVNSCSKVSVSVVCVGEVDGNPVTLNVGDVNSVSNNALSALNTSLDSVFANVGTVNVSDINALAADIATTVAPVVNTWVATTVNTVTTATSNVTNTVTSTLNNSVVNSVVNSVNTTTRTVTRTLIPTTTNTVTNTVIPTTTNTITKTCSVLLPPATTGGNTITVGCS